MIYDYLMPFYPHHACPPWDSSKQVQNEWNRKFRCLQSIIWTKTFFKLLNPVLFRCFCSNYFNRLAMWILVICCWYSRERRMDSVNCNRTCSTFMDVVRHIFGTQFMGTFIYFIVSIAFVLLLWIIHQPNVCTVSDVYFIWSVLLLLFPLTLHIFSPDVMNLSWRWTLRSTFMILLHDSRVFGTTHTNYTISRCNQSRILVKIPTRFHKNSSLCHIFSNLNREKWDELTKRERVRAIKKRNYANKCTWITVISVNLLQPIQKDAFHATTPWAPLKSINMYSENATYFSELVFLSTQLMFSAKRK